jgi:hypothetical protein
MRYAAVVPAQAGCGCPPAVAVLCKYNEAIPDATYQNSPWASFRASCMTNGVADVLVKIDYIVLFYENYCLLDTDKIYKDYQDRYGQSA